MKIPGETVNLTVALPAEDIETVQELSKRTEKPERITLAEAIYLKKFIDDELKVPETRLYIAKPGSLRLVIFS